MTPFDRLGRFVVRRARWVVGAWVVLLLAGAPVRAAAARPAERRRLHPRRPRVGAGEGAPRHASSASPPSALVIVFSSPIARGGDARLRDRRRRRRRATSRPRRTSRASCRTPSRRARSRPTATPPTTSSSSTCRPTTRRTRCRSSASASGRRTRLTVELAGGPAFYGDVQAVSEADLRRSEVISLPLAALALVFVFGSLVAAGVPLVGRRGGGRRRARRRSSLVASVMPMSIFVLNLATLLGLGLGVDYSLLMTSRFREELAAPAGRVPTGSARRSGSRSRPPAGPSSSPA